MDINTLRGISTIVVMITFIAICLWTYSSKRKSKFDDASNLPFNDEEIANRTTSNTENKDHE